jgi:hypothetical protein
MPTVVRASTSASASRASQKSDSAQLVSIALFAGIGLLVSLVAVIFGVQGAWY